MAFYRCGGGGIPSSLKTDMNAVLNKKFGTSSDYPPAVWAKTINLLGKLPEATVSGSIVTFSDGAEDVPLKSCEVALSPSLSGHSSVTVHHTDGQTPPVFSEDYTANLVRTIYGGEVDIVNGEGQETYGKYSITGQETGYFLAGTNNNGNRIDFPMSQAQTPLYSGGLSNIGENKACLNSATWTIGAWCVYSSRMYIVVPNEYTTYETALQYLSDNNATFVYPLAMPTDFTFEPVEINSRLGNNTMWSEQGEMSVTYRRDIDLALGGQ